MFCRSVCFRWETGVSAVAALCLRPAGGGRIRATFTEGCASGSIGEGSGVMVFSPNGRTLPPPVLRHSTLSTVVLGPPCRNSWHWSNHVIAVP